MELIKKSLTTNNNLNCKNSLSQYFTPSQEHTAQVTVIKPNGEVIVSRDNVLYYPYGPYLSNIGSWYAISSFSEECLDGKQQIFSVAQKKPGFYDRLGFSLNTTGYLNYSPIWSAPTFFKTQLICENGHYYGWSDDNFLSLTFTFGKSIGSSCTPK
eukprot:gene7788-9587_t